MTELKTIPQEEDILGPGEEKRMTEELYQYSRETLLGIPQYSRSLAEILLDGELSPDGFINVTLHGKDNDFEIYQRPGRKILMIDRISDPKSEYRLADKSIEINLDPEFGGIYFYFSGRGLSRKAYEGFRDFLNELKQQVK